MAKIFTHDCKKCRTETEHNVLVGPYNLHVTCKVCGCGDTVSFTELTPDRPCLNCTKDCKGRQKKDD